MSREEWEQGNKISGVRKQKQINNKQTQLDKSETEREGGKQSHYARQRHLKTINAQNGSTKNKQTKKKLKKKEANKHEKKNQMEYKKINDTK